MSPPERMVAAVLRQPGRFELEEVAVPALGRNEVLVKVAHCGICGTDIHIFHGRYAAESLPMIPGHEFTGTVAAVGTAVAHVEVGAKVVADNCKACGHCYYCRRNQLLNCAEICQIGIGCDGGFAEYVVVPEHLVLATEADLSFAELAMVEPIACVVRSAKANKFSLGESVVVIGAGPIGNLQVQMMRLLGCAPVIALELSPARAALAEQVGADIVITDPAKAQATVREATDGRGADHVIEVVGKPELYRLAFELIRPGGHVAAFGLSAPEDTVPLALLDTVLQENSLAGSVAGMGPDMRTALTLVENRRFDLAAFTQDIRPLEQIQATFENIAANPATLKIQFAL